MSVKIITGSIGSGKTRYCTDEMEKLHNLNPKKRCIMIVPSHYSHETEHMLITKFGGTGLNNIECTSFEKLSRELLPTVLRRLGAPAKHVLIVWPSRLGRENGSQWVITEMPVRRKRGDGLKDRCSSRNKKEGPTQRDT